MKRSCVVLAFVLSISFAQSQPPSPGPSKPAQDQQRHEDAKGKVADRPEKTIQPGSPSAFSKTESSDHTDNKSDQLVVDYTDDDDRGRHWCSGVDLLPTGSLHAQGFADID